MTKQEEKQVDDSKRLLRDGYSVPEHFYQYVKTAVADVVQVLDPEAKYKTEHLMGKDSWDAMSPGDRRIAGRCLSHMVACGELPLAEETQRHEYPKWYRVTVTN